jgi:drug/metabolite transporter (DMT)-like permease
MAKLNILANPAIGLIAAIAGLLITSSYPAITRATIVATLPPADLLLLRMLISGMLLAPYLWYVRKRVEPRVWRASLQLSFLHGWGMVAFVLLGLQFAPAAHSAMLGPGTISIWIALIAWCVFRQRPTNRQMIAATIILLGVMVIIALHLHQMGVMLPTLYGDGLFLLASLSGAGYLFIAGRWQIPAIIGVAICAVPSMLVVVPIYIAFGSGTLFSRPLAVLLWHGLYQGVLIGILSYTLVNFAVNCLGSQRAGLVFAATPICAALFGLVLLQEVPSAPTWICLLIIACAVIYGAKK